MRIIALEEHFTTEEFARNSAAVAAIAQPGVWAESLRLLLDFSDGRLAAMDRAGVDLQVLSLNSPGIQAEDDARIAVKKAAQVNDLLAEMVARRPDRFAGFAVLPLQDPEAAVRELERAITTLGLKGAVVNAHSKGTYLDDPALCILWGTLQSLDVPLYLHPGSSVDTPHVFGGHPVLAGPMWSWGNDTASHVLRCVFGGVFDDHPQAKLMVGHMGEGLPYVLWRLDSRWSWHNHHGIELQLEKPSDYIRRNLYITTSGVCDSAPLLCALSALGSDKVFFAADYPFEDLDFATRFLREAPIHDADRAKIAHLNAERLLRL